MPDATLVLEYLLDCESFDDISSTSLKLLAQFAMLCNSYAWGRWGSSHTGAYVAACSPCKHAQTKQARKTGHLSSRYQE